VERLIEYLAVGSGGQSTEHRVVQFDGKPIERHGF
jgi:hypothetical protein